MEWVYSFATPFVGTHECYYVHYSIITYKCVSRTRVTKRPLSSTRMRAMNDTECECCHKRNLMLSGTSSLNMGSLLSHAYNVYWNSDIPNCHSDGNLVPFLHKSNAHFKRAFAARFHDAIIAGDLWHTLNGVLDYTISNLRRIQYHSHHWELSFKTKTELTAKAKLSNW